MKADRNYSLKAVLLAGTASSFLLLGSAGAQTTEPQVAQATTAQEGNGAIESVVVTARRRSENVQKIPLSVSVQSGEELLQHQITDVYALETLNPSLSVQANTGAVGAPLFTIRGIGTLIFGSSFESSVGLVVDDVAMGRPELSTVQLFDINNVEVLKGPQGMLFGKNASAGLINIVTNDPVLNETDFIAHAQYGSMNTPNAGNSGTVDLALNAPISDDAALRVDGFYTHYDGFGKNVLDPNEWLGEDLGGIRVKLLWEPTSWVRIWLDGDFALENGPGEGLETYDSTIPASAGGVASVLNALAGVTASRNNDLFTGTLPIKNVAHVGGTSLKSEFDLGDGYTVTNIVAYRRSTNSSLADDAILTIPILDSGDDKNYSQFSEELRLTSPADQRFTYQGGLYYLRVDPRESIPSVGGGPLTGAFVSEESAMQAESKAVYFEGNYKLLDSLRLTAGARYTHDWMADNLSVLEHVGPVTVGGAGRVETEHNNISYRASLDYDIAPDVMAYALYSQGYKGPGLNQGLASIIDPALRVVAPEIPTDWELGLKSLFFDDRLRLNISLYSEIFRNFQTGVEAMIPLPQEVDVNAGKLRAKGVELEVTAIPIDNLTITGGALYNDTAYEGAMNIVCYPGQVFGTGVNQCNNTALSGLGVYNQNINGDPLVNAPKWTETLTVRYEQPVWSGWTGFVQGQGYFRSPYNGDAVSPGVNPQTQIGASALFNMSTGVMSEDGHYGITLFVNNLFDKRVPVYLFSNPGSALAEGSPGLPGHNGNQGDYNHQFDAHSFRTVGVSFDYHM